MISLVSRGPSAETPRRVHSTAGRPIWLFLVVFSLAHATSCSPTGSQPPGDAGASDTDDGSSANADGGDSDDTPTPGEIAASLGRGDRAAAVELARRLLKASPDAPRAWQVAADALLRGGEVDEAARLYDRYATRFPESVPYLWQRGIALAFAGRYGAAIRQFETHRRVNPNDVENAAWHFLCVAKSSSIEKARENRLPAPGDPRPPLEEVLGVLADGDPEPVVKRIESFPADSPERRSAAFYGYLYLGMVADAEGESDRASELVQRSVENAGNDYMGDVARVYAERLKNAPDR